MRAVNLGRWRLQESQGLEARGRGFKSHRPHHIVRFEQNPFSSQPSVSSIFFLLLRPTLLYFHPKMVQQLIRNQTRFRFRQRTHARTLRCVCELLRTPRSWSSAFQSGAVTSSLGTFRQAFLPASHRGLLGDRLPSYLLKRGCHLSAGACRRLLWRI